MKKYKTVKISAKKLFSLTCDKCGKTFSNERGWTEDLEVQEFAHIDFTGGYGSIFGDGTHVECDICQHCLKEMIGDICKKTGTQ